MDLFKKFKDFIEEKDLFHAKDKLLLAVSGGVDSTVLCHLCKEAGFDFSIAHCNFQLRGEDSDRDEQFVKALAEKMQVPFFSKTFDTKAEAVAQKKSIETTARELRYAWFEELSNEQQFRYILTAHHADDNIETVIMNFFRGTGIKGLRGILSKLKKIIRPLLFARRKEIEEYASANQVGFVTDHTNLENSFTRNLFRNRIIPEIQTIYPETEQNIIHTTARMTEVEQLYQQAVELHRSRLLEKKGNEWHIPLLKLKKTTPLHTITYEITREFGFSAQQAAEVISLLDAENGKYIASSTHRVIKNRKWLIISPLLTEEADTIVIEATDKAIVFEGGKLSIAVAKEGLSTSNQAACLDAAKISFPLLLRKWKTGDYFYPLGMKKKKKLARFFIDQKLSKTEKENVWVIESNKRIVWVIGYRIDDRFKIQETTTNSLHIKWTK